MTVGIARPQAVVAGRSGPSFPEGAFSGSVVVCAGVSETGEPGHRLTWNGIAPRQCGVMGGGQDACG